MVGSDNMSNTQKGPKSIEKNYREKALLNVKAEDRSMTKSTP